MAKRPFDEYRLALDKALKRGDSTEHTHRPALKKLLESVYPGTTVTNEPKHRTDCGAVDMKVSKGELTLGFIETKDVGVDLVKEEKSDQLQRYRKALPSLILTDYLQFRWYRDGKLSRKAVLGTEGRGGKIEPEGGAEVRALLDDFIAHEAPPPATASQLAKRLAGSAIGVRDLVERVLRDERERGPLHDQLEAFRRTLLPDLDEKRFADLYAQTLCYGLFAARVECPEGRTFTRQEAAELIPKTNPFLRKLFQEIAGVGLDDRIRSQVDYVDEILNAANMQRILEDLAQRTGRKDQVVHFYETFLAHYDPKMRELRGVYYTPEPVVSYIVRSVDEIVRKRFGKPRGLADKDVFILDPACGTGSFLAEVIHLIHDRLDEHGELGTWNDYVRETLLKQVLGFELLMAPYAVAHLKLAMLLRELGYDFQGGERLGVYLTNTLEEAIERTEVVWGKFIVDESNAAADVKKHRRILVVLGNPPYSGHSANASYRVVDQWVRKTPQGKGRFVKKKVLTWIGQLIEEYKKGCPELHKPAQAKWLHDDYVKFIRWGQWRIEQTGEGVLSFVTNHAYLDNPTFRGMRMSLKRTFNDIRILDLHGSTKKKETTPRGARDENVFDIQQGVAIGVFVREPDKATHVHHADLWGLREKKYKRLVGSDVTRTRWKQIGSEAPLHLFVPRDERLLAEYEVGWRIPDAMDRNGDPAPGIVTTHDEFAISWSRKEAAEKVEALLATKTEVEARRLFRLCSQSQWVYARAKSELKDGAWRKEVRPVLYRPFDRRWTVYNRNVAVHRRERVMGHMLAAPNLAICTTRSVEIGRGFEHVFCSRQMIQHHTVSLKEVNYMLPLYLYPSASQGQTSLLDSTSPWPSGKNGRTPNLSPKCVEDFAGKLKLKFVSDGRGDLKKTFGPEDIFDYIYAVLHSPTYRKRYAEFLKTDFPRVPLTSDRALFRKLVKLGGELVALHLMESPVLKEKAGPKFNVKGSNEVEKVRYDAAKKRVYVNKTQHFEGIPQEVWDFHVGGYQVMSKWLKDRAKAKRRLSTDDVRHYKRIAVALAETIRLMAKIDKAIPRWPIR